MFGAYFLIGLMITCYSFTRKRESCLGVDHAIPKVLLLILILSVKDRCTLGRVWQDGGERSCGTGTQLAAAAAPTRVNTHICPEICNRFALIVFFVFVSLDLWISLGGRPVFSLHKQWMVRREGLWILSLKWASLSPNQWGSHLTQMHGCGCGGLRRTGFASITTWVYQY